MDRMVQDGGYGYQFPELVSRYPLVESLTVDFGGGEEQIPPLIPLLRPHLCRHS